jgi:hypothetical protein
LAIQSVPRPRPTSSASRCALRNIEQRHLVRRERKPCSCTDKHGPLFFLIRPTLLPLSRPAQIYDAGGCLGFSRLAVRLIWIVGRRELIVTLLSSIVTVAIGKPGKAMENQHRRFEAPTSVNVTVAVKRPREYLTEREIERLMDAARQNRWGHRDATAILIAYRHGLRASELVSVRWDDLDLTTGRMHVRRAKGGETSVHPILAFPQGARQGRRHDRQSRGNR